MNPEQSTSEGDAVEQVPTGSNSLRHPPSQGKLPLLTRLKKVWWLIAFPMFAVVVVYIGGYTGYQRGLEARSSASSTSEAQSLLEQFNLGVEDLNEGRYDLARQRAEYILGVDPNNEAAIGLLDLALQALNRPTLTPTLEITPTITTPTPTPDLGSIESTFSEASAAIERGDWELGLSLLIKLRHENPEYRSADVDNLMYRGLRNRGLERILSGFLEQGIYDLSLAETFQQLDEQALSWRRSAEFYLFANSFVGLDWAQAYTWFSQLCGAAIWDSCYKFAVSAHGYGDNLVATEDPCGALVPYDESLVTFFDDDLVPTATEAAVLCMTATAPSPTPTETPTPEETFTPTPDTSITEEPEDTSTPTPSITPTTEP
jgi:tetratricopeptide (TPR) repeat protein